MEKKGALSGLRVIDFGQYIAGPLTSMILGDYGADVIHIDPPGGPRWDGWKANAVLSRGKRNIILDLKKASDLEIAKKLIATADIVVENFRPGVMDRLGLGYEACAEINPTLIYHFSKAKAALAVLLQSCRCLFSNAGQRAAIARQRASSSSSVLAQLVQKRTISRPSGSAPSPSKMKSLASAAFWLSVRTMNCWLVLFGI